MEFLSLKSKEKQRLFFGNFKKNKFNHLQIDDLITIEHTKLKPLTISVAVDAERRLILGAEV